MNVSYPLFLIVPPGLEDLALKELELKCPVPETHVIKGGIELTADMEWVVEAHLKLKIPTRILLRITQFKARDLPKLYQKFLGIKINQYLSHPEPIFHITCTQSRLNHTGRIEDTLKDAMKEHLRRSPMNLDWQKKNFDPQNLYVRFDNDECTISLDLTGEPLYKRGQQTIKGEAPIRENFAAAMLFELFEDSPEGIHLVDPTCGSGTLLTEARHFYSPLHLRKFSFEETPLFKGKIIKKQIPAEMGLAESYLGNDLEQELIEKLSLDKEIKLQVGDALKLDFKHENLFIIANPPYGLRIEIQGKKGLFLKDLWFKLLTQDTPLRLAMVLPSDFDGLFQKLPTDYKIRSHRKFRNGGLMVSYFIWERINF